MPFFRANPSFYFAAIFLEPSPQLEIKGYRHFSPHIYCFSRIYIAARRNVNECFGRYHPILLGAHLCRSASCWNDWRSSNHHRGRNQVPLHVQESGWCLSLFSFLISRLRIDVYRIHLLFLTRKAHEGSTRSGSSSFDTASTKSLVCDPYLCRNYDRTNSVHQAQWFLPVRFPPSSIFFLQR